MTATSGSRKNGIEKKRFLRKLQRTAGMASKQKIFPEEDRIKRRKKWQATCIAPLQPHTFAVFPPWRILQELVVQDLPLQMYNLFVFSQGKSTNKSRNL